MLSYTDRQTAYDQAVLKALSRSMPAEEAQELFAAFFPVVIHLHHRLAEPELYTRLLGIIRSKQMSYDKVVESVGLMLGYKPDQFKRYLDLLAKGKEAADRSIL